jgi:hypothetical protein
MRRARHRRPAALAILAAGLALAAAPSAATAAGPPAIGAAWSTEVAATSARLHAEVNPEGSATAYHFNYITEAAYEANLKAGHEGFLGSAKAPAGADPSVGSGASVVSVLQSIGALAPETAYRYRVVAHSSAGTVEAARSFATQGLPGTSILLDGRGWEMVSPVDKNGGQVGAPDQSFGGGVLQAAANGEAATYSSSASFGEGAQGAPPASQYISRRAASGWQTENITAPTLAGAYGDDPDGVPYQLFSEDLARGLLLDGRRCEEGEECPRSYSLRDDESAILTSTPEELGLRFEGASSDLRHLLFSAQGGLYEWSGGGLEAISEVPGARLAAKSGAVSEDGSRVYFTTPEDSPILLREGGATKSVPETAGGGGEFQAASSDGAVAFFTKGPTLYRYSAQSQASEPIASEVLGVLGASADGSSVFFQSGAGLYRWRSPGPLTQIAPGAEAAQPSDWPPATATARVSADGAHLAFLSKAELSGYENTDQRTGQPDTEAYLYDATANGGAGSLTCVSCNPTGERPLGPSSIPGAIANGTGEAATDSYKPRDLSQDGRRLFFDSEDALVLTDTNNASDAYEWEAPGEGSCQRPGGCLALLSSGRSSEGASFIDASSSGSDAFFLTDGSLVPQDPGSVDLYDAREGGGFPAPPPPISCEGDACQPLPPEPEDPNPGTLLSGAGNPPVQLPKKPRKCRKGFVHRHGHCVRKPHRKKAHGRRGRR